MPEAASARSSHHTSLILLPTVPPASCPCPTVSFQWRLPNTDQHGPVPSPTQVPPAPGHNDGSRVLPGTCPGVAGWIKPLLPGCKVRYHRTQPPCALPVGGVWGTDIDDAQREARSRARTSIKSLLPGLPAFPSSPLKPVNRPVVYKLV